MKRLFTLILLSFIFSMPAFALSFSLENITYYDYPDLPSRWESNHIAGISGDKVAGNIYEDYIDNLTHSTRTRTRGFVMDVETGSVEYLPVTYPGTYYSFIASGIEGNKVMGTIFNSNVGLAYDLEDETYKRFRNYEPGRSFFQGLLVDAMDVDNNVYVGTAQWQESGRYVYKLVVASCDNCPCIGVNCDKRDLDHIEEFTILNDRYGVSVGGAYGSKVVGWLASRYSWLGGFVFDINTQSLDYKSINDFPLDSRRPARLYFEDIYGDFVLGVAYFQTAPARVYFIYYNGEFYPIEGVPSGYFTPKGLYGKKIVFEGNDRFFIGELRADGLPSVPEPPPLYLYLFVLILAPFLRKRY